jgi:hypothetical protein
VSRVTTLSLGKKARRPIDLTGLNCYT